LVSGYRSEFQECPAAFVVRILGRAWRFRCGFDSLGGELFPSLCQSCL